MDASAPFDGSYKEICASRLNAYAEVLPATESPRRRDWTKTMMSDAVREFQCYEGRDLASGGGYRYAKRRKHSTRSSEGLTKANVKSLKDSKSSKERKEGKSQLAIRKSRYQRLPWGRRRRSMRRFARNAKQWPLYEITFPPLCLPLFKRGLNEDLLRYTFPVQQASVFPSKIFNLNMFSILRLVIFQMDIHLFGRGCLVPLGTWVTSPMSVNLTQEIVDLADKYFPLGGVF